MHYSSHGCFYLTHSVYSYNPGARTGLASAYNGAVHAYFGAAPNTVSTTPTYITVSHGSAYTLL